MGRKRKQPVLGSVSYAKMLTAYYVQGCTYGSIVAHNKSLVGLDASWETIGFRTAS